jgi:outer membrane protein assembly factor BamE
MIKKLSLILVLALSACVYRLDIQQGNILAQKDIDKLRPELTKNQVLFVLGTPVVDDGFADDTWVYLYSYRDSNKDVVTVKKLELNFNDDKLVSASGDYPVPESLQVKP